MTSHCLMHSIPACTGGSALWGKPVAMPDVTHLSAVGQTASAARDLMPCMVEGSSQSWNKATCWCCGDWTFSWCDGE